MSKNASKEDLKANQKGKIFEKILIFDKSSELLLPIKWKSPYFFNKKNYIAIIIGLDHRYEFERIFCTKKEFEIDDEDERRIRIGFEPSFFKDGLIIEEKYSFKEKKTFITNTNYYEISITEDGEIWGEKLIKTQIKNLLYEKQQKIYQEIKEIMNQFGEEFTLFTMRSILKQKENAIRKMKHYFFFD